MCKQINKITTKISRLKVTMNNGRCHMFQKLGTTSDAVDLAVKIKKN